jgi:asparagine synthase (glutamine-hydrolysing)
MCGLAGRYHSQALPPDIDWHARANDLLAHRGPDGAGYFADTRCELVHRRLALIDLSSTGHQPLFNEDESVCVVFNGEIYNHAALQQELVTKGHRFRGTSDTEVLVHLYEEAGAGMVERLRGMFAFAIYDRRNNTVLLARDRFGIKPLYYAQTAEQWAFASEIKALLALDNFRPTLNRQACYDYLGLLCVPEPQTAFREIQALPMGHYLHLTPRGSELVQYHQVTAAPEAELSASNITQSTSTALRAAVAQQAVADVPVAALLSGGIDSSLVVAAYCQHAAEPPITFNVAFPDPAYDEASLAVAVARHYGTRHHTINAGDWEITPELVQQLLEHFDQPFADSSLLPTYWVSRAIREHGIICALSGDGGDEAFGGYACFWRANRLQQMMRWPRWLQSTAIAAGHSLTRLTRDLGRQAAKAVQLAQAGQANGAVLLAGLANYLNEEQKAELIAHQARQSLDTVYRHFDGYESAVITDLEDLSLRLTETGFRVALVSDMLRKVDMMSMLASIEVRVPLLDEEVVAQGLRLPHRLKTDGQAGKLVLRALAREWLPEAVVTHPKKGFRIPLDRLATPAFHTMLADLLLSRTARIAALVDQQLVAGWLAQFKAAASGGALSREGLYQRIFILLALELWLRKHRLQW